MPPHPPTPTLAPRNAVITGASAGIGVAIARQLASAGCRLVLNARRADRLEALAAELNATYAAHAGKMAAIAPGDSSDDRVISSMLDAAGQWGGEGADLVVINAGRGLSGSVMTSDAAQWEEMIRTNLLGAARLMRAAAERMLAGLPEGNTAAWLSRPRDIVVIGSIVGRHVSPFSSMYGATKFGLHGLTEGARRELGPRGVRVTLVEPGFVVSEFQGVAGYKEDWFRGVVDKIGPVLSPEDVARTVVFIASQPAHVHVSDIVVRPTRQEYP